MAKTNYVNLLVLGFSGLLLISLRGVNWQTRLTTAVVISVGVGFDSLCFHLGIIRFYMAGDFILPQWLIALWILFAWILPSLIFQFQERRYIVTALSSVFGPLSYYSGISFGIVDIPHITLFFIVDGIFWGLLIYLVHSFGFQKWRLANGS